MAEPTVMSLVDQVIPKLGDSWFPLMEREFARVLREKAPADYRLLLDEARGWLCAEAVADCV